MTLVGIVGVLVRGRADNVADKHVYSDGGGHQERVNIVVFLVVAVWLLQGFDISSGLYLECAFPP